MNEAGEGNFAVLGFSSGGPNAMAVAALSPNVTVCGLVSSDGPYSKMSVDQIESVYGSVPEKIDVAWLVTRTDETTFLTIEFSFINGSLQVIGTRKNS